MVWKCLLDRVKCNSMLAQQKHVPRGRSETENHGGCKKPQGCAPMLLHLVWTTVPLAPTLNITLLLHLLCIRQALNTFNLLFLGAKCLMPPNADACTAVAVLVLVMKLFTSSGTRVFVNYSTLATCGLKREIGGADWEISAPKFLLNHGLTLEILMF